MLSEAELRQVRYGVKARGAVDTGKSAPFLKNEAIVQQSTFFNELTHLLNLRLTAQPLLL